MDCFDNDDEMATGSDRRGMKPIKRMALEAVRLIGSPRATFHLGPGPNAAPTQEAGDMTAVRSDRDRRSRVKQPGATAA